MSEDAPEAADGTRAEAHAEGEGADADAAVDDAAAQASDGAGDDGEASLADRVADHDEALGEAVRDLEERVSDLEAELDERTDEVDDLTGRLKRTKADFQNYKKRAKRQQAEARERAAADILGRVMEVRDNLLRALEQDENADIRDGVEATVEQFDRVLAEEGADLIDPDPGVDVDPTRHEVMMRVDSSRPEGSVVDVYRQGVEMGETVVREAQVTVSTGSGDAEADADEADGDGGSDDGASDADAGAQ